MKINYGKLKNRNIIIGNNKQMRPTQSMTKSIIFNSIKFDNKKVLDLFAGTGSLGFEALSLGAAEVIWIDNNFESVQAIKKNIDNFNLDKNKFKIFKSDFRTALKNINNKQDVIFLDPPFISKKYYSESLSLLFNNNILSLKGIIIIESPNHINIHYLDKFLLIKEKKVGSKNIIFLETIK